jgi:hypothetical protein
MERIHQGEKVNTFGAVRQPKRAWFRRTIWAGALGLVLALLLGLPTLAAPAQQSGEFAVYLPLVRRSATAPTPTPELPDERGGVFATRDVQTTSAAAAVDANGGMHFAYVGYAPMEQHPPAYYAYCAPTSSCIDPASWRSVTIGQDVEEVQLALTPAGQPRLLYRSLAADSSVRTYSYAACDTGCTAQSQWRATAVATTSDVDALDWDLPQRSFALDHLGRPRFVYFTGGLGDPRKGAFYAYCDTDCTANPESDPHWFETHISLSDDYGYEIVRYSALTFTQHNQPRLLAMVFADEGQQSGIFYLACDQACGDANSWQRVYLIERGWGPSASWDLELDSNDRPRLAIYQEGLEDGGGDQLIYGWCNADCLNAASWESALVGLPQHDGEDPDLELDTQGRPRIAYHSTIAATLNYLWCNNACESNQGQWTTTLVEPNETLDASFAPPVPPACDQAGWLSGYRPALALDAQGNPRIATDALRSLRCAYSDPSDPSKPPQTRIVTYRYTRFVFLPQP